MWAVGQAVIRVRGETRTPATVIAVDDAGNALVMGMWYDPDGQMRRPSQIPNYIEGVEE